EDGIRDLIVTGVQTCALPIYELPLILHEEGLDTEVCRILGLPTEVDLSSWEALVERVEAATRPVRIGIIGKYVSLPDAYLSVARSEERRVGKAWRCQGTQGGL